MSGRISLKIHKKGEVGTPVPASDPIIDISIIEQGNRDKAIDILRKKIPKEYHDQIEELETETLAVVHKTLQPHATPAKVLKLYHMILCKLCKNINTNEYIIDQLSTGQTKLKELPHMSDADLNPKEWSKQLSIRAVEAAQVVHGNTNIATTDQIKCPKRGCGAPVRYTEEQTRSADEAATIKAECVECGYRFNI